MKRKLTISAFVIAGILMLIISGNQVIIKLFGTFSEKLITEYHELLVLQELKVSLSKTVIYVNSQHEDPRQSSQEDLRESLEESNRKFNACIEVLSSVHKNDSWERIDQDMTALSNRIDKLIHGANEVDHSLYLQSFNIINDILYEIDYLVEETTREIEEYEIRNSKVILHGTITVIAFGTLLLIFLFVGGMRFIKNLTRPISQLVEATRKIIRGDRNLRVQVDSDDEFKILADSFNSMLENLKNTTISESHLRNIIDSLFGALLVTDKNSNIQMLNKTTGTLLGYGENELLGKNVMHLFVKNFSLDGNLSADPVDLKSISGKLRKKTRIIKKDGNTIPVYVTCTILDSPEGKEEGMIVVGHDLTEEKEQEKKIERIRKEGVIAINDAQENERLRIATDIHDGLGQMLTGISYSIQELEPVCEPDTILFQKLQNQVDSTIQEAKSIAHDLTPILIKDFGLIAAIENLVSKTNELGEIKVIFNAYDFDIRIDTKLEKAVYRITQEALNNILKHAKAKSASIELFLKDNLVLVIEDDGVGFDTNDHSRKDSSAGIGLISMKERAYAFDGLFSIESQIGEGTEIIVEVPCRKKRPNGNI